MNVPAEDASDQATMVRPLLSRSDMRQMLAGYALVAISLVAWPDKSTWTNGTVALIAFVALIGGWLAWILIVERRLPRPFRGSEPRPQLVPGALAVAVVVSFVAFLVGELLRDVWPREYFVVDEPLPAPGSGEWLYGDFFEIPINVARHVIAYLGVAFGGIVLGSGLLQAFHARRAGRREGSS